MRWRGGQPGLASVDASRRRHQAAGRTQSSTDLSEGVPKNLPPPAPQRTRSVSIAFSIRHETPLWLWP